MATPPVCRIMDYGKFRYEESQKAKESRKKTVHVSIKEVKFRPKIGKGDFDTKVRHMHEFLAEGHKVKVTLQFRGREMAHPELGSTILDAVLEQLGPTAKVETQARLEGRNMTMVLAPEKKVVSEEAERGQAAHGRRRHPPASSTCRGRCSRHGSRETARSPRVGTSSRTAAEQPTPHRHPSPTPPDTDRPVPPCGPVNSPVGPRPPHPQENHHAQDEDQQDRGQAVQEDRYRQAAPPAAEPPAPVREEAVHPHPPPRRQVDVHPGDAKKIKRLLGER